MHEKQESDDNAFYLNHDIGVLFGLICLLQGSQESL